VAVNLEAPQLLAAIPVGGQSSALKSVPDVRQICDPPQVYWYSVEGDKEAGKQQEGHGHDGGQENTVLHIHGSTNHQSNGLSDKRDEEAGRQEHGEAEELPRLRSEVIDDRHVDNAEDCLEEKVTGC